MRCVANFSGSLLEQLTLSLDEGWEDHYCHLTRLAPEDMEAADYDALVSRFFSVNHDQAMARFPRYVELLARRDAGARLERAEIIDLQVLFNLAWCGFTIRREDARAIALVDKGRDFSPADREMVLNVHSDAMRRSRDAWKGLVASGQVEPSVTPMYHPILPLLIDSHAARVNLPEAPLPDRFEFPEDATAHVLEGLEWGGEFFGRRPGGIWPSEGSVSPALVDLLHAEGVQWIASDEAVLHRSEVPGLRPAGYHQRAWVARSEGPQIFFRDHELSDLIGFTYARTEPTVAVADFLERVRSRESAHGHDLVTVILDGENAWEHYPNDGAEFLDALYGALEAAEDVETTTPASYLAAHSDAGRIQSLWTGSWIDADFHIWIGRPETNRAWQYLGAARRTLSGLGETSARDVDLEEARRHLMRAEGSDWFWWYGDDFDAAEEDLFDWLFREHLAAAYRAMGEAPPTALAHPISGIRRAPEADQPHNPIAPALDGRVGGYLKWLGAGRLPLRASGNAMAQTNRSLEEVRFGFGQGTFYMRWTLRSGIRPSVEHPLSFAVSIEAQKGIDSNLVFSVAEPGRCVVQGEDCARFDDARGFFVDCLELAVPLAPLGVAPGEVFWLNLAVRQGELELERAPRSDAFEIPVPDASSEARDWLV